MANFRYPLDITGKASENRVTEVRTLNAQTADGFYFVVLKDAPFYEDGFIATSIGVDGRQLVKGVDFIFTHYFPEGSKATRKNIYGGILIQDRNIAGEIRFEFQTVGGQFTQPSINILEEITRQSNNIRFVTWGEIANVPQGFAPIDHTHESSDVTGFDSVIGELQNIRTVLVEKLQGGSGGSTGTGLAAHISNPTAHTAAQVGLGNVPNWLPADYVDYNNSINTKFATPAGVRYAIQQFGERANMQALKEKVEALATITQETSSSLGEVEADVQAGLNNLALGIKSLEDYDQRLKSFSESITTNEQIILDMGQEVSQIRSIVSIVNNNYSIINSRLEQLGLNNGIINDSMIELDELIENLTAALADLTTNATKRLEALEARVNYEIYPLTRFITSGTVNFRIQPGETRFITLIGGGAGAGASIAANNSNQFISHGESGGSTVLFCNTNLDTGELKPSGTPIAIAFGGYGGMNAIGNVPGTGGLGGVSEFNDTGIGAVRDALAGNPGQSGEADRVGDSVGGTGYEVRTVSFGRGASTEPLAGAGGGGGYVLVEIENTKDFDLEFTIKVGDAGRSVLDVRTKRAKPGFAAILPS